MNIMTIVFSILGVISTVTGIVLYMKKVKSNQTPKVPVALMISFIIAFYFGIHAIQLSETLTETIIVSVLFTLTTFITLFLIFILLNRSTPIGDIKVNVGENMLSFKSIDYNGKEFNSDNLVGKRTLLKFFRGSWCPYCSAELIMFNEMKSTFDQHNVQIIALSNNTPAQANIHKIRDKLNFTLLSDSLLTVIKTYGVEHHKAIGWKSENMITIFGIAVSTGMFKYRSMAIPTSILIDENGIVQWIDQSDDYRIRASQDRVTNALSALDLEKDKEIEKEADKNLIEMN